MMTLTSETSEGMPCVYVMAGNFLMFQIIVFVDPPSVLIMQ